MAVSFVKQSNCEQKLEGMVRGLCWYKRDATSLKKKIMCLAGAYYAWAYLNPKYWAAAVEMAFPHCEFTLAKLNRTLWP